MELTIVTSFFKYLTFTVGGVYFLTAFLLIFAQKQLISIQKRFVDLDDETLQKFLYGYVALFKILFIIFVLGPYLSLLLMS